MLKQYNVGALYINGIKLCNFKPSVNQINMFYTQTFYRDMGNMCYKIAMAFLKQIIISGTTIKIFFLKLKMSVC